MTTHQVVFLLLDLALIVVLARLFGAAARRLGQPPVIGEILAGILVGPTLFGNGFSAAVFPTDTRPMFAALANVGVAFFMFMVGLELDGRLLRGRVRIAVSVSAGSIMLPFGLGVALAFYLLQNHAAEHRLGFLLFIGAAMSVTAFPVLARILTDRGMTKTMLGGLALTCAAVDDVLAWTLLAGVVMVSGNAGGEQLLVMLFPVYVAVMFLVVRPLLRRVITEDSTLRTGQLAMILVGVLVSGAVTEWTGMHFIFGAFLFGAVFPRSGTERLRGALLEWPGTVQHRAAAARVLRRRRPQGGPLRARPDRARRTGTGSARSHRRQVRRCVRRGTSMRPACPEVRGAGHADEHPGPDRVDHPQRRLADGHSRPEDVLDHGGDGGGHHGDGRSTAEPHLPAVDDRAGQADRVPTDRAGPTGRPKAKHRQGRRADCALTGTGRAFSALRKRACTGGWRMSAAGVCVVDPRWASAGDDSGCLHTARRTPRGDRLPALPLLPTRSCALRAGREPAAGFPLILRVAVPLSAVSSPTRSPAVTASWNIASSRRPALVVRSGAASSAVTSASVR